jgi:hypothetical protein
MPHYYLHIRHNGDVIEDPEGFDLPDLSEAQLEALVGLRQILAEAIRNGAEPTADAILIVDETGQELASVPLHEALPTKLRKY